MPNRSLAYVVSISGHQQTMAAMDAVLKKAKEVTTELNKLGGGGTGGSSSGGGGSAGRGGARGTGRQAGQDVAASLTAELSRIKIPSGVGREIASSISSAVTAELRNIKIGGDLGRQIASQVSQGLENIAVPSSVGQRIGREIGTEIASQISAVVAEGIRSGAAQGGALASNTGRPQGGNIVANAAAGNVRVRTQVPSAPTGGRDTPYGRQPKIYYDSLGRPRFAETLGPYREREYARPLLGNRLKDSEIVPAPPPRTRNTEFLRQQQARAEALALIPRERPTAQEDVVSTSTTTTTTKRTRKQPARTRSNLATGTDDAAAAEEEIVSRRAPQRAYAPAREPSLSPQGRALQELYAEQIERVREGVAQRNIAGYHRRGTRARIPYTPRVGDALRRTAEIANLEGIESGFLGDRFGRVIDGRLYRGDADSVAIPPNALRGRRGYNLFHGHVREEGLRALPPSSEDFTNVIAAPGLRRSTIYDATSNQIYTITKPPRYQNPLGTTQAVDRAYGERFYDTSRVDSEGYNPVRSFDSLQESNAAYRRFASDLGLRLQIHPAAPVIGQGYQGTRIGGGRPAPASLTGALVSRAPRKRKADAASEEPSVDVENAVSQFAQKQLEIVQAARAVLAEEGPEFQSQYDRVIDFVRQETAGFLEKVTPADLKGKAGSAIKKLGSAFGITPGRSSNREFLFGQLSENPELRDSLFKMNQHIAFGSQGSRERIDRARNQQRAIDTTVVDRRTFEDVDTRDLDADLTEYRPGREPQTEAGRVAKKYGLHRDITPEVSLVEDVLAQGRFTGTSLARDETGAYRLNLSDSIGPARFDRRLRPASRGGNAAFRARIDEIYNEILRPGPSYISELTEAERTGTDKDSQYARARRAITPDFLVKERRAEILQQAVEAGKIPRVYKGSTRNLSDQARAYLQQNYYTPFQGTQHLAYRMQREGIQSLYGELPKDLSPDLAFNRRSLESMDAILRYGARNDPETLAQLQVDRALEQGSTAVRIPRNAGLTEYALLEQAAKARGFELGSPQIARRTIISKKGRTREQSYRYAQLNPLGQQRAVVSTSTQATVDPNALIDNIVKGLAGVRQLEKSIFEEGDLSFFGQGVDEAQAIQKFNSYVVQSAGELFGTSTNLDELDPQENIDRVRAGVASIIQRRPGLAEEQRATLEDFPELFGTAQEAARQQLRAEQQARRQANRQANQQYHEQRRREGQSNRAGNVVRPQPQTPVVQQPKPVESPQPEVKLSQPQITVEVEQPAPQRIELSPLERVTGPGFRRGHPALITAEDVKAPPLQVLPAPPVRLSPINPYTTKQIRHEIRRGLTPLLNEETGGLNIEDIRTLLRSNLDTPEYREAYGRVGESVRRTRQTELPNYRLPEALLPPVGVPPIPPVEPIPQVPIRGQAAGPYTVLGNIRGVVPTRVGGTSPLGQPLVAAPVPTRKRAASAGGGGKPPRKPPTPPVPPTHRADPAVERAIREIGTILGLEPQHTEALIQGPADPLFAEANNIADERARARGFAGSGVDKLAPTPTPAVGGAGGPPNIPPAPPVSPIPEEPERPRSPFPDLPEVRRHLGGTNPKTGLSLDQTGVEILLQGPSHPQYEIVRQIAERRAKERGLPLIPELAKAPQVPLVPNPPRGPSEATTERSRPIPDRTDINQSRVARGDDVASPYILAKRKAQEALDAQAEDRARAKDPTLDPRKLNDRDDPAGLLRLKYNDAVRAERNQIIQEQEQAKAATPPARISPAEQYRKNLLEGLTGRALNRGIRPDSGLGTEERARIRAEVEAARAGTVPSPLPEGLPETLIVPPDEGTITPEPIITPEGTPATTRRLTPAQQYRKALEEGKTPRQAAKGLTTKQLPPEKRKSIEAAVSKKKAREAGRAARETTKTSPETSGVPRILKGRPGETLTGRVLRYGNRPAEEVEAEEAARRASAASTGDGSPYEPTGPGGSDGGERYRAPDDDIALPLVGLNRPLVKRIDELVGPYDDPDRDPDDVAVGSGELRSRYATSSLEIERLEGVYNTLKRSLGESHPRVRAIESQLKEGYAHRRFIAQSIRNLETEQVERQQIATAQAIGDSPGVLTGEVDIDTYLNNILSGKFENETYGRTGRPAIPRRTGRQLAAQIQPGLNALRRQLTQLQAQTTNTINLDVNGPGATFQDIDPVTGAPRYSVVQNPLDQRYFAAQSRTSQEIDILESQQQVLKLSDAIREAQEIVVRPAYERPPEGRTAGFEQHLVQSTIRGLRSAAGRLSPQLYNIDENANIPNAYREFLLRSATQLEGPEGGARFRGGIDPATGLPTGPLESRESLQSLIRQSTFQAPRSVIRTLLGQYETGGPDAFESRASRIDALGAARGFDVPSLREVQNESYVYNEISRLEALARNAAIEFPERREYAGRAINALQGIVRKSPTPEVQEEATKRIVELQQLRKGVPEQQERFASVQDIINRPVNQAPPAGTSSQQERFIVQQAVRAATRASGDLTLTDVQRTQAQDLAIQGQTYLSRVNTGITPESGVSLRALAGRTSFTLPLPALESLANAHALGGATAYNAEVARLEAAGFTVPSFEDVQRGYYVQSEAERLGTLAGDRGVPLAERRPAATDAIALQNIIRQRALDPDLEARATREVVRLQGLKAGVPEQADELTYARSIIGRPPEAAPPLPDAQPYERFVVQNAVGAARRIATNPATDAIERAEAEQTVLRGQEYLARTNTGATPDRSTSVRSLIGKTRFSLTGGQAQGLISQYQLGGAGAYNTRIRRLVATGGLTADQIPSFEDVQREAFVRSHLDELEARARDTTLPLSERKQFAGEAASIYSSIRNRSRTRETALEAARKVDDLRALAQGRVNRAGGPSAFGRVQFGTAAGIPQYENPRLEDTLNLALDAISGTVPTPGGIPGGGPITSSLGREGRAELIRDAITQTRQGIKQIRTLDRGENPEADNIWRQMNEHLKKLVQVNTQMRDEDRLASRELTAGQRFEGRRQIQRAAVGLLSPGGGLRSNVSLQDFLAISGPAISAAQKTVNELAPQYYDPALNFRGSDFQTRALPAYGGRTGLATYQEAEQDLKRLKKARGQLTGQLDPNRQRSFFEEFANRSFGLSIAGLTINFGGAPITQAEQALQEAYKQTAPFSARGAALQAQRQGLLYDIARQGQGTREKTQAAENLLLEGVANVNIGGVSLGSLAPALSNLIGVATAGLNIGSIIYGLKSTIGPRIGGTLGGLTGRAIEYINPVAIQQRRTEREAARIALAAPSPGAVGPGGPPPPRTFGQSVGQTATGVGVIASAAGAGALRTFNQQYAQSILASVGISGLRAQGSDRAADISQNLLTGGLVGSLVSNTLTSLPEGFGGARLSGILQGVGRAGAIGSTIATIGAATLPIIESFSPGFTENLNYRVFRGNFPGSLAPGATGETTSRYNQLQEQNRVAGNQIFVGAALQQFEPGGGFLTNLFNQGKTFQQAIAEREGYERELTELQGPEREFQGRKFRLSTDTQALADQLGIRFDARSGKIDETASGFDRGVGSGVGTIRQTLRQREQIRLFQTNFPELAEVQQVRLGQAQQQLDFTRAEYQFGIEERDINRAAYVRARDFGYAREDIGRQRDLTNRDINQELTSAIGIQPFSAQEILDRARTGEPIAGQLAASESRLPSGVIPTIGLQRQRATEDLNINYSDQIQDIGIQWTNTLEDIRLSTTINMQAAKLSFTRGMEDIARSSQYAREDIDTSFERQEAELGISVQEGREDRQRQFGRNVRDQLLFGGNSFEGFMKLLLSRQDTETDAQIEERRARERLGRQRGYAITDADKADVRAREGLRIQFGDDGTGGRAGEDRAISAEIATAQASIAKERATEAADLAKRRGERQIKLQEERAIEDAVQNALKTRSQNEKNYSDSIANLGITIQRTEEDFLYSQSLRVESLKFQREELELQRKIIEGMLSVEGIDKLINIILPQRKAELENRIKNPVTTPEQSEIGGAQGTPETKKPTLPTTPATSTTPPYGSTNPRPGGDRPNRGNEDPFTGGGTVRRKDPNPGEPGYQPPDYGKPRDENGNVVGEDATAHAARSSFSQTLTMVDIAAAEQERDRLVSGHQRTLAFVESASTPRQDIGGPSYGASVTSQNTPVREPNSNTFQISVNIPVDVEGVDPDSIKHVVDKNTNRMKEDIERTIRYQIADYLRSLRD